MFLIMGNAGFISSTVIMQVVAIKGVTSCSHRNSHLARHNEGVERLRYFGVRGQGQCNRSIRHMMMLIRSFKSLTGAKSS